MVTFHPAVSSDDVTTPFPGGMKVGDRVLNNVAKVLSVDGRFRLEAVRQLHAEGDVGWIEEHIAVCLIVRKDRVAIRNAEEMKMSKLANKVTSFVSRDYTFLDLLKTFLNLAIAFENKYNKKCGEARILDIAKGMMGCKFHKEI